MVVEHRLARLVQLGIRQARYFGRAKTKFQVYLAATVANLTLLANQTGPTGGAGPELSVFNTVANSDGFPRAIQGGNPVGILVYITSALLPPTLFPKWGFPA